MTSATDSRCAAVHASLHGMTDSPPPFRRIGPDQPVRPVILSVPHAGRHYPPELIANARAGHDWLQRLEDRHADALAIATADAGFTTFIAERARAWIDLNRAPDEWDRQLVHDAPPPGASGGRVRAGLGLVPTRLHPIGPLWRQRMTHADLSARIALLHRPWHTGIATALADARRRFGGALLIDLHSMPRQPGGRPEFIVGDRHGATAGGELVDHILALAEGEGLKVARNAPYAGAYTVQRHGRTGSGIEAIQIEIDRSLYLDAQQRPDARATQLARLILAIAVLAEESIAGSRWPIAAE